MGGKIVGGRAERSKNRSATGFAKKIFLSEGVGVAFGDGGSGRSCHDDPGRLLGVSSALFEHFIGRICRSGSCGMADENGLDDISFGRGRIGERHLRSGPRSILFNSMHHWRSADNLSSVNHGTGSHVGHRLRLRRRRRGDVPDNLLRDGLRLRFSDDGWRRLDEHCVYLFDVFFILFALALAVHFFALLFQSSRALRRAHLTFRMVPILHETHLRGVVESRSPAIRLMVVARSVVVVFGGTVVTFRSFHRIRIFSIAMFVLSFTHFFITAPGKSTTSLLSHRGGGAPGSGATVGVGFDERGGPFGSHVMK